MTIREKDRRRRQSLSRVEKQIMKAQAAFDKTKSFVWAVRLKDLRTKALALA